MAKLGNYVQGQWVDGQDDGSALYNAVTGEQIATVRGMIEDFASRTPITRLFGHREVANKLCPGFEVVDSYWTTRDVA